MKNMILTIVLCWALLSSSTSHAFNVNDFCKGDVKGPDSPKGYHCLPPDTVTADDFKYNLFRANVAIPEKVLARQATVDEFPAVNGLGIFVARVDIERGGVFPMHTPPRGSEALIMVEGESFVGIVAQTKAYVNTLKPGDVVVFPQGLLHFQVNTGKGKSVSYSAFSSARPVLQLLHQNLFANNVSSAIIALATFLDEAQVKKLKDHFGGTN